MAHMPATIVRTTTQAELNEQLALALAEAARTEPLAPQVLVAHSSRLASHLAAQAAWRGRLGFHADCLTWLELAIRLTAEDRPGRRLLTPEAATWLLHRFLERTPRPPGYLDAVLDVRGFRAALLQVFEELAGAGLVPAAEAERLLVQNAASINRRLRHTLELFIGFRKSFTPSHDDASSILLLAAATPAGRARLVLGSGQLWIVAHPLEVLEQQLLAHLERDPELHLHIFVPPHVVVDVKGRYRAAPVLPASRRAPRLHVLSAPGEESEAVEVGRRLLAAARRGLSFHDMAVLGRTSRPLPMLAEALSRIGIPVWLTTGRHYLGTRHGRALLAFLDLLETGLGVQPALRFLAVAPLRWRDWAKITEDPSPSAWERVARDAFLGIGLDDWIPKLEQYRSRQEGLARARREDDEPAQRARAVAAAAVELQQVARALCQSLERFPTRAAWGDWVRATRRFVQAAFMPGAERDSMLQVLDRLRDLETAGHSRATQAEFRDAVQALLAATPVETPPPNALGAVTVGTATAYAGACFKLVCLVGVRDGEWPPATGGDPILREADRELVRGAIEDPEALPGALGQQERERALFAAVCGAARDELVLSFARLDPATGAARLPSTFLVEEAERAAGRKLDFASLETQPFFERVPLLRREAPKQELFTSVAEFDALAVRRLGLTAGRRYVRRLGAGPARSLAAEALRNQRKRFTEYDGLVRDPAARQSLREAIGAQPLSASQLSHYMTCPFRFFMRRLLRLEPLDRDPHHDLTAFESGVLVHSILERFHARLRREQRDPASETFAALRTALQEAASAEFAFLEASGQAGAWVLWSVRKARLREDLTRFLRHEMARLRQPPGWQPVAFEQRFGPSQQYVLEVTREADTPIAFRGSIDRVDRARSGQAVCVVDYKSGRKVQAKRYPQSMQLVVYLLALCGADTALLRASEGRFVYVTRRGGFGMQRLLGSRVAARRDAFDALVRDVVAGCENGEFFPAPGPGAMHCTTCDYRTLCDIRVGWQASQKATAGQDWRHRQLPDFGDALEDATDATPGRGGA